MNHCIFRSVSNILEPSNRQAWLDLSSDARKKVATELLLGLDENAFLLAGVMNEPDVFMESSDILSKSKCCAFFSSGFSESELNDSPPFIISA